MKTDPNVSSIVMSGLNDETEDDQALASRLCGRAESPMETAHG